MSFVRVQQEINVPQIIFRTVGETTTMVTFGQLFKKTTNSWHVLLCSIISNIEFFFTVSDLKQILN